MARLFGRHWSREELLQRMGDLSQVAGVQEFTLRGGRAEGVRAVEVRTGTGFRFWVLPDRGLDIAGAEYGGVPLAWMSPVGIVHPAYFEPEGFGWLRSFFGGLLVTCGLTYLGEPASEAPSWCPFTGAPSNDTRRVFLGLHGRVANTPASHVWADGDWEGDEYVLWVQGRIREAIVFGETVELRRRISTRLGENRLWLHDRVENLSFEPVPHMILYHINGGFPAVDAGSEVVCTSVEVAPLDAAAEAGLEEWYRFVEPTPAFPSQVFYHRMATDAEGYAYAALINKSFNGGQGFGFYVKYRQKELPFFVQWKRNERGTYVCGLEPANCHVEGRPAEAEKYGTLQWLQGGESREYFLEIGVLTNQGEIARFEEQVRRLRGEQRSLGLE